MDQTKRFTKPEKSWIMYDWANSAYYTIIVAAVFPTFFAKIAPSGDIWWGYATSFATLVVALLAPIMGAIADYSGMKKRFFSFFLALGVIFTGTMALLDNWKLLMVGYIISYIGIMGTNLFYDSFLTDVTTHERMDRVSATGYAMGYIGGSTIPFVISIALIMLMNDGTLAVKLSVVITAIWWAVFSIPILKNVKQTHHLGALPKGFIKSSFVNLGHTLKDIVKRRGLFLFMFAYFFYIDGVNTVIHMSTIYGATLGLNTTGMILALMVTQIVAAPCSILFARFAEKIGAIKILIGAVGIYLIICLTGFYMGFSLEPWQNDFKTAFDSASVSVGAEHQKALDALKSRGVDLLSQEANQQAPYDIESSYISGAIDEATVGHADAGQDAFLSAADAAALKATVFPVIERINLEGSYLAAINRSNILFWCMAVLVGTCQGGIQSLSRSYFGRLVPPEKSNEYFGFFDIFGKFAAVIGPALYALFASVTGRPSIGILSLVVLFLAGGLILILGQRRFKEAQIPVSLDVRN